MNPISLPRQDEGRAGEAAEVEPADLPLSAADDGIVSVNQTQRPKNRAAKTFVVLVALLIVAGAVAWFGQNYIDSIKKAARNATSANKAKTQDQEDLLNPEGSRIARPPTRVGADSGRPPGPPPGPPPVAAAAPVTVTTAPSGCEGIPGGKALRGGDGKVLVNAQGRALCVGADGQVIAVPAIDTAAGGAGGGAAPGSGGSAGQTGLPRPASRFGGSLFADGGEGTAGTPVASAFPPAGAVPGDTNPQRAAQTQQAVGYLQGLLRGAQPTAGGAAGGVLQAPAIGSAAPVGPGGGFGAPVAAVPPAPPPQAGSVGSMLSTSSTPVARASRMVDQDLMLPKARQLDCVLTTRIVNEVPGFTSCVLTHDLYSSNGRVKLLEKGSAVDGEYGSGTMNGQRSVMVVWDRIRTPDGVQVDLKSPGTDPLGTSGLPGYLDNRWPERIGTALLISLMGDLFKAEAVKQAARNSNGGTVVLQQGSPYQGTTDATQQLSEQVLRQTITTRPTLYINEGQRIAIYVARDLDFTPVYALRLAGRGGATRILE